MITLHGLTCVTPPEDLPISLELARLQVNAEDDHWNDLLQEYIGQATEYLDGARGALNRALMPQTWRFALPAFPPCYGREGVHDARLRLPLPPLISVTSITYRDGAGNAVVMDGADYAVFTHQSPGFVLPTPILGGEWPATAQHPEAVVIVYRCGFADETRIPGPIRKQLLHEIGQSFKQRETTVTGTIVNKVPTLEGLLANWVVRSRYP